ncbi:MAG: hypothetical protein IIZ39_06860, partial [Blautia sp.]|nr:hypothetical protein [Blautia sp.]
MLSIDLETFSGADLTKTGVYRYAEDPSFEILLFGVSIDGGPVTVYDLKQGERLPEEILYSLLDSEVTKWAFNAAFERICLSRYLWDLGRLERGSFLDPRGWRCDMVWSAYLGYPLSLAGAGAALGLESQKMTEGKDLIRYFCVPCKPTKSNGGRKRNLPSDAPEKWELFKKYNKRDVEVEIQIQEKLKKIPVPESVWREYWLDQEINDRGIQVDMVLVDNALKLDALSQEHLCQELTELTGVENPRSVQQLLAWLHTRGVETKSLDKASTKDLLQKTKDPLVREVLLLRQQLAKSAVKMYKAMEMAACKDRRCRGMFLFYGANRSGRFSGRIIQLQNLFRNSLPDLDEARSLVRDGNYEALEMLYDSVPGVLAECVRTAFVPRDGNLFYVADFSAIEARVIAWLAGEKWRQRAFARGEDIYCASASKMFGVPVVKHGINGELRQKGKIAELALGYGGSVGALTSMGALDMGLKESELQPLVNAWRNANPNIVALWWDVDRAIKETIKEKGRRETHGIKIEYKDKKLLIRLPSGRHLCYIDPEIGENRFGGESVTYMGTDLTKHWSQI